VEKMVRGMPNCERHAYVLGENYWATEKNIKIYQYCGMVCYYGKYSDLAQFFILIGGMVQALGSKPLD